MQLDKRTQTFCQIFDRVTPGQSASLLYLLPARCLRRHTNPSEQTYIPAAPRWATPVRSAFGLGHIWIIIHGHKNHITLLEL